MQVETPRTVLNDSSARKVPPRSVRLLDFGLGGMKWPYSQRIRYLGVAVSIAVITAVSTTFLAAGSSATESDPQVVLENALRLADVYNWAGAAGDFTEAERLFLSREDDRGALYARLGRIRATVEQNERRLPSVSAELADELDTNPLLKSDQRLRLFALVVKGDIDAEFETASMKEDWTAVQALAKELGDSKWQNRAQAQLGLAAFYDGDLEAARTHVGSAIVAANRAGDKGALIRYLSAMGMGLVQTNTSEQALPYFDQALKIAASTPESGYPFVTQEGRCGALLRLHRLDEANALATEILSNARRGLRSAHEAIALRALASAEISRGDDSAGVKLLEEGIAIAEQHGHLRILAELQIMKAQRMTETGNLDAAEAAAEAAARASQETGDLWGVPRQLQLLGELYSRRGKYDQADDVYSKAEVLVDDLIGRASTVIDKTALIRTSGDIFTRHFSLVVDRFNDTERAFSIVEQVRGRAARDLLMAGGRMSPVSRDAERNISRLRIQLMSARATNEVRKLRDEIFLAEQARWSQPSTPALKNSISESVSLANIRTALSMSEAILVFVVAEPRSYCIVITRSTSRVIPISSKRVIEEHVEAYRRSVAAGRSATREARDLYRILLHPMRNLVAAQRLVVVRDGVLHQIPFDALIRPSGEYVLQTQIVEYSPSATNYYFLSRTRETRRASNGQPTALAIGGIPYSSTSLGGGEVNRGYKPAFNDLPSSADEALAVRDAFGPARTRLLTGWSATESGLTRADLRGYDLLHFGVHGVANSIYPDRAALILLSDKQAGHDGFLESPEITQLHLNPKLVVLSACESASGSLQGQEGVASLSRAFLLAGAHSVVSSLWMVDDSASLYLMKRFYRRIAEGKSFDTALTEAKREFIRDFGPNAVPLKWAAFILEGFGRGNLTRVGFKGRSHAR